MGLFIALLLSLVCGSAHAGPLSLQEAFSSNPSLFVLPPAKTVLQGETGGRIDEHWSRFRDIYNSGADVEVHGKCNSACTLITNMPKSRLCFAEGSHLGFHWAREVVWNGPPSRESTEWMIDHYPPDIRAWLDAQGGIEKMPKDGFWIMPAFILWGMGYRRCGT
jgi:hypothetical protein